MSKITIYCHNLSREIEIDQFTSAFELIKKFNIKLLGGKPIGITVDNKSKDIYYKIHRRCTVKFIDKSISEGYRIYINSLSFIFYKAAYDLYPNSKVRIEHSASNGYYCEIIGAIDDLDLLVSQVKNQMRKIIDANLPFEYELEETDKLIEIYKKQGLEDKVKLLERNSKIYTKAYRIGNVYNNFYGPLAANTGQIDIFDLQSYYKGLLLVPPNNRQPHRVNVPIIQKKIFNVLTEFNEWCRVLGVSDIEDVNRLVEKDGASELIKISESLHEKKISEISNIIINKKNIKVILISGPSSSGKTTFSKKLAIHLIVGGLKAVSVSMDNYFVDREDSPRDANGNYDFESLKSVDVDKFNDDMNKLINNEEVEIPYYNFSKGVREYNGNFVKLSSDNVLIIEGIHALNPTLLTEIDSSKVLKIYVSALITMSLDNHNRIPTSDLRLMRRLVRDGKYRGMESETVLELWSNVRMGEEKYIFPYQENADVMFNSALPYELSVLKPFVCELLKQIKEKSPYFNESKRLLKIFRYLLTVSHKQIPPTSIVREFIGGSSFEY